MENNFIERFFIVSQINDFLTWDTLIYVFLSLIFMFFAKWVYDKLHPKFNLDNELLETDNKALAISFLGYIFGLGIIVSSVLQAETSFFLMDLKPVILANILDLALWFFIGVVLLSLAKVINNRFILKDFDNQKEIIQDKNVGTGIVELGSYVASSIVIAALLSGGSRENLFIDILETTFFFALTQFLLVIFSYTYNRMLSYDLHKEVEKDNEAVGIAFGLNLVAMGIIMSFPITNDGGFILFLFWFINGMVLLTLARLFLDKIIFHKSRLEEELVKDNNWGIALLEGALVIVIALIINSSFA